MVEGSTQNSNLSLRIADPPWEHWSRIRIAWLPVSLPITANTPNPFDNIAFHRRYGGVLRRVQWCGFSPIIPNLSFPLQLPDSNYRCNEEFLREVGPPINIERILFCLSFDEEPADQFDAKPSLVFPFPIRDLLRTITFWFIFEDVSVLLSLWISANTQSIGKQDGTPHGGNRQYRYALNVAQVLVFRKAFSFKEPTCLTESSALRHRK